MRQLVKFTIAALALAGASSATSAVTVANYGGTLGSFSYSVLGNEITVNETWTAATLASGPVFLQFSGLDTFDAYLLRKNITNNTGLDWLSLATELLDPSGDVNDATDPAPQPSFVPVGYSTSNDTDGLSFAQGFGIPRDSDVFSTVAADELSNSRDFLDYYNGTAANGSSFYIRHGLIAGDGNQPFLLSQRANARSVETPVPEPATWVAMIIGFGMIGHTLRRTAKTRSKTVFA